MFKKRREIKIHAIVYEMVIVNIYIPIYIYIYIYIYINKFKFPLIFNQQVPYYSSIEDDIISCIGGYIIRKLSLKLCSVCCRILIIIKGFFK